MKKILSFLLALSLVLALPAVGLAADETTVGLSTGIDGVAEEPYLVNGRRPEGAGSWTKYAGDKVWEWTKPINHEEIIGYPFTLFSDQLPTAVKVTLDGKELKVEEEDRVEENGEYRSVYWTGVSDNYTEKDLGRTLDGEISVTWADNSTSVFLIRLKVIDKGISAVEKPYLVRGRRLQGAGSETKYTGDKVWEWTKTINRDGGSGFPFTLFSDQKPAAVKVTLDGKELEVEEEDKLEENGEYRSVYWTGVFDNYTEKDVGKTFNGEISVTWADNSTSIFLIRLQVTSRPLGEMYIIDRNGNPVENYWLQLGEAYTAKIQIIDRMNVLGETHAGQRLTAQWAVESGYDRIALPLDSPVPHDENGVPEPYAYADDPAFYTIPEDSAHLGELPFGLRFTAKAAGNFDIYFALSIDGHTFEDRSEEHRIVGERPIIEEGTIEESFEKAEGDAVVIPVETGKGLDSSSFEKILQLAKENGTKTVSLKVTGATLTIDTSKLDLESAQYQKFLKDLEARNGGVYDPSVNLNIPPEAENRGYTGGRWMNFSHSGTLPAPITVTVDVPKNVAGEDKQLRLWYYNSVTGRANDTGTTVTVQDGRVSFDIDHCSAYALYPVGYDPNPKASAAGSSGSSGTTADFDWADARSELKAAKSGETVRLLLPAGERVPASLLRALAAKDNVALVLRQGMQTLRIKSGDIGSLDKAQYRFSELQELFGDREEADENETKPEKTNPGTGAPVRL